MFWTVAARKFIYLTQSKVSIFVFGRTYFIFCTFNFNALKCYLTVLAHKKYHRYTELQTSWRNLALMYSFNLGSAFSLHNETLLFFLISARKTEFCWVLPKNFIEKKSYSSVQWHSRIRYNTFMPWLSVAYTGLHFLSFFQIPRRRDHLFFSCFPAEFQ